MEEVLRSITPNDGEPILPPERDLWACPTFEVFATLRASERGLDSGEARKQLDDCGPNRVEARGSKHLLAALLRRFRSPLVIVLLGAASVSAATGDPASFAIISSMVLLSIILDFVQEHRA